MKLVTVDDSFGIAIAKISSSLALSSTMTLTTNDA